MLCHYCFSVLNLDYAIGNVQENRKELKLNGTHQLLFNADVVKLSGENKYGKVNTEILLEERRVVSLEQTQRKLNICFCLITKV
jgi:hypothetical protein